MSEQTSGPVRKNATERYTDDVGAASMLKERAARQLELINRTLGIELTKNSSTSRSQRDATRQAFPPRQSR